MMISYDKKLSNIYIIFIFVFFQVAILHARRVMVRGYLPVPHVLTTFFLVGRTVLVCVQEEHMLKKDSVYLAMSRAPIVWGEDTIGMYLYNQWPRFIGKITGCMLWK